jgi:hypothetical protein
MGLGTFGVTSGCFVRNWMLQYEWDGPHSYMYLLMLPWLLPTPWSSLVIQLYLGLYCVIRAFICELYVSVGEAISCEPDVLYNIRLSDVTMEQYCPTPLHFLFQLTLRQNLTGDCSPSTNLRASCNCYFVVTFCWWQTFVFKNTSLIRQSVTCICPPFSQIYYNVIVVLVHLVFSDSHMFSSMVLVHTVWIRRGERG